MSLESRPALQDPARRLCRGGDRLRLRGVHPQREPLGRHHDAALAAAPPLRQGQVPRQQEGATQDEENAGNIFF